MKVSIGTFNVNNLFSRFNFKAEISEAKPKGAVVKGTLSYTFTGPDAFYKLREYMGKLVQAKKCDETVLIADRIKEMNADVLAVQEVEDLDTLHWFNKEHLADLGYTYVALIEGNDPRLIDVGLLSRYPLGAVTSWRFAVHEEDPSETVFGRDLLQADVLTADRSGVLFTLYNTHLKSHLVDWKEKDAKKAEQKSNDRRRRQAEVMGMIIAGHAGGVEKIVVLGDMNDPVDSPYLVGFTDNPALGLVDAVTDVTETRPAKADTPPPATKAWTHRFKKSGEPAAYELYDQIWVSPDLMAKKEEAWIGRRTKHSGDGSDHDPAWIVLEL